MKKLLAAAIFLLPAAVLAQNPFNGNWKLNPDRSNPSTQPIVFSLSNGIYDCTTCVPQVHVKADGNDQPVAGLPHNTVAVKEIDSHMVEVTSKRDGKLLSEELRTVSQDGQILHAKVTNYSTQDRKSTIEEIILARIGRPVPGANLCSGSWVTRKMSLSGNSLVTTYKETDSNLNMLAPTGVSWVAKFDGNDYPVKGSSISESVALKKLNDRAIELTIKEKGITTRIETLTVSADGRTMTTVLQSKLTGRTSTWISNKQ